MKNVHPFHIAAAFLFFIAIACKAEDKESTFTFPGSTPGEVIQNIKPFLDENNIQLDKYTLESISYDYMKSRWHVSYSGKSLAVGDHFSIVVGDDLKEIKLVPGL
jgi:hypothetical protein